MQRASVRVEENGRESEARGQERDEIGRRAEDRRAERSRAGRIPPRDPPPIGSATTLIPVSILPMVWPPAAVNTARYPPFSSSRKTPSGTAGSDNASAERQIQDAQRQVHDRPVDRPSTRRSASPASTRATTDAGSSVSGFGAACATSRGTRGSVLRAPTITGRGPSSGSSAAGRARTRARECRLPAAHGQRRSGNRRRRDERRVVAALSAEERKLEARRPPAGDGRRPSLESSARRFGESTALRARDLARSARNRRADRSAGRRSGWADRAAAARPTA